MEYKNEQPLPSLPTIILEGDPHSPAIPVQQSHEPSSNTHGGITLLFVPGIEGTGHHLWLNITTTMSLSYPNDVTIDLYHGGAPYHFSPDLKQCFLSMRPKDASPQFGPMTHTCTSVKRKLKQLYHDRYKDVLDRNEKRNILVHLRSFSYPFLGLDTSQHIPNLIGLNTMVNELNTELNANIFTLKLIVLKREWVSCMVSSCINRYGRCTIRARILPQALHLLDLQLRQISQNQWFVLNYDDFVQRPMEYKDIVSEWLGIDSEIVQRGLSLVNKKKGAQDAVKRAWADVSADWSRASDNGDLSRQNLKGLKDKIVNGFYSEEAKTNAPLFYDDCVVVTPENKQFISNDFQCEVLQ
eukprot:254833_1